MMNDPYRIFIGPALDHKGHRRAGLSQATFGDAVIVSRSRTAFLDACRVLLKRGLKGPVEMWRPGSEFPSMRSTVEQAAGLTIAEDARGGPHFVSYEEPRKMTDADKERLRRRRGVPTGSEISAVLGSGVSDAGSALPAAGDLARVVSRELGAGVA